MTYELKASWVKVRKFPTKSLLGIAQVQILTGEYRSSSPWTMRVLGILKLVATWVFMWWNKPVTVSTSSRIQSRWHELYCFVRTNGGELIIQSAFTKKTIRRPTTHSSNIAVTTRPFNEIGRNLTQSTHRAIPPKVVHRGLSFVGLQREYQFTNFDKQETIALLTCYSFLYMWRWRRTNSYVRLW